MQPPSDDAAAGLTLPPVRAVPIGRPFRWLRLGWRDFTHAFGPSVFHGLAVAAGGLVIVDVEKPEQPFVYERFTADGAIDDAHDARLRLVGPIPLVGGDTNGRGVDVV